MRYVPAELNNRFILTGFSKPASYDACDFFCFEIRYDDKVCLCCFYRGNCDSSSTPVCNDISTHCNGSRLLPEKRSGIRVQKRNEDADAAQQRCEHLNPGPQTEPRPCILQCLGGDEEKKSKLPITHSASGTLKHGRIPAVFHEARRADCITEPFKRLREDAEPRKRHSERRTWDSQTICESCEKA